MPAVKRIKSKAEIKVAKALQEIEASTTNKELKENLKQFRILNAMEAKVDANKKAIVVVVPLPLAKLCRK